METPGESTREKEMVDGIPPPPLIERASDTQTQHSSTTAVAKQEDLIIPYDPDEHGFRRIVRNFTPSYVWLSLTLQNSPDLPKIG